ncbi:MAG: homoserine dehydrogenase [Candidatus Firestonebacteria bacterium]|jgi:homoserine dehydrogenase|nr:homoserine dehydrogenase [Candidatus Firestonebacteria bacterium]
MKNDIKVGLIGFGTVGASAVKIINENNAKVSRRAGGKIIVKWIADKDITTSRGIKIDKKILTTDAYRIINDPEIDIVVELIGGVEPAHKFIIDALNNGKHVVTANKAVLAKYWEEIMETAKKNGVDVYIEASVGAGIPVIQALHDGLAANNIKSIYGIVNGTTNYILTRMLEDKKDFAEVLKDAQKKGYAEADPSTDLEGKDAGNKLAILSSIAFDTVVDLKDVYVEGISRITRKDMLNARELGYVIKLLAIAKAADGELDVRVHPALISCEHQLAAVDDVYNAVYFVGDAVGPVMFYGQGAGGASAASAVVSDIIYISRNIINGIAGRVPSVFFEKGKSKIKIKPIDEIKFRYFLRFIVLDKPGVFAKIAGVLAKYGISISSVDQKEQDSGSKVPVIITTDEAKEKEMRKALAEIDKLSVTKEKTLALRIEKGE